MFTSVWSDDRSCYYCVCVLVKLLSGEVSVHTVRHCDGSGCPSMDGCTETDLNVAECITCLTVSNWKNVSPVGYDVGVENRVATVLSTEIRKSNSADFYVRSVIMSIVTASGYK